MKLLFSVDSPCGKKNSVKVTFHCLVVDVFSCEILRAYSRRNSKYYQSCMSMERPVESTLEPLAHFGPASRLHVSFSLSGQNPHFFTKSIHIADVSLCQRNPQVFGRLAVRTHYFRAMRGSSPSHRGMTILAYDLHQKGSSRSMVRHVPRNSFRMCFCKIVEVYDKFRTNPRKFYFSGWNFENHRVGANPSRNLYLGL